MVTLELRCASYVRKDLHAKAFNAIASQLELKGP